VAEPGLNGPFIAPIIRNTAERIALRSARLS
jgi:hypothetical protein